MQWPNFGPRAPCSNLIFRPESDSETWKKWIAIDRRLDLRLFTFDVHFASLEDFFFFSPTLWVFGSTNSFSLPFHSFYCGKPEGCDIGLGKLMTVGVGAKRRKNPKPNVCLSRQKCKVNASRQLAFRWCMRWLTTIGGLLVNPAEKFFIALGKSRRFSLE